MVIDDHTEQLQREINLVGGATSGVSGDDFRLPPSEIRITKTISLRHWTGRITGNGVGNSQEYRPSPGRSTVIRWDGPPDIPMFRLVNCRNVEFENIRFEGGVSKPSYCVEMSAEEVGHGANQQIGFDNCWFGRYPWASSGLHRGDVMAGIGFTGPNRMNDKFRIRNCMFRHCGIGVDIPNTQSIWGSVTDCIFDNCQAGIRTASTVSLYNSQWNECDLDLMIESSARVNVFGGFSEKCKMMARLGMDSYLHVHGGLWQVGTVERTTRTLVDMFPSRQSTLRLDGVQFTQQTEPLNAKIRVGGHRGSGSVGNWLIDVNECDGIQPSQIDIMPDSFWAQVPRSQGRVTWTSRVGHSNFAFQNNLARGGRTRIDSRAWDMPGSVEVR